MNVRNFVAAIALLIVLAVPTQAQVCVGQTSVASWQPMADQACLQAGLTDHDLRVSRHYRRWTSDVTRAVQLGTLVEISSDTAVVGDMSFDSAPNHQWGFSRCSQPVLVMARNSVPICIGERYGYKLYRVLYHNQCGNRQPAIASRKIVVAKVVTIRERSYSTTETSSVTTNTIVQPAPVAPAPIPFLTASAGQSGYGTASIRGESSGGTFYLPLPQPRPSTTTINNNVTAAGGAGGAGGSATAAGGAGGSATATGGNATSTSTATATATQTQGQGTTVTAPQTGPDRPQPPINGTGGGSTTPPTATDTGKTGPDRPQPPLNGTGMTTDPVNPGADSSTDGKATAIPLP